MCVRPRLAALFILGGMLGLCLPGDGRAAPVTEVISVETMTRAIDTTLGATWVEKGLIPSRPATDHEFIRRASLDLIGRNATRAEIDRYLKDPQETRRALLIDRLLASEDYSHRWADLWTVWLQGRSGVFARGMYRNQLNRWLQDEFAKNTPHDKLVERLLTATGKNTENGAVNFILAHTSAQPGPKDPPLGQGKESAPRCTRDQVTRVRPAPLPDHVPGDTNPPNRRDVLGQFDMVPLTGRIGGLFLGLNYACIQCHDHPYDGDLQQRHFWGLNAYLRQVERVGALPLGPNAALVPLELRDNPQFNADGKVPFEKTNGIVVQVVPGLWSAATQSSAVVPPNTVGLDRRKMLAKHLCSHENFAPVAVNRIWTVLFGHGFHTRPDWLSAGEVLHEKLLARLANDYRVLGYDQKQLLRAICRSQAYQLSSVFNETNSGRAKEVYLSRMPMKKLTPEQIGDIVFQVTGADPMLLRPRLMDQLATVFGSDDGLEMRELIEYDQCLWMMHGTALDQVISAPKSTVVDMVNAGKMRNEIISEVFVAVLNREPTAREQANIASKFAMRIPDRRPVEPYQDLLWSLLNSNEFLFNH